MFAQNEESMTYSLFIISLMNMDNHVCIRIRLPLGSDDGTIAITYVRLISAMHSVVIIGARDVFGIAYEENQKFALL